MDSFTPSVPNSATSSRTPRGAGLSSFRAARRAHAGPRVATVLSGCERARAARFGRVHGIRNAVRPSQLSLQRQPDLARAGVAAATDDLRTRWNSGPLEGGSR